MSKLKADVQINAREADIDLDLTPEQSVKLLEALYVGSVVHINLVTPVVGYASNGKLVLDQPEAYAG